MYKEVNINKQGILGLYKCKAYMHVYFPIFIMIIIQSQHIEVMEIILKYTYRYN